MTESDESRQDHLKELVQLLRTALVDVESRGVSKDQLVEWKKIDRLNFKTSATMIRSSPLVQQFLDPPAQRIGDTNRRSTARCLAQWFLRRASQTGTCQRQWDTLRD